MSIFTIISLFFARLALLFVWVSTPLVILAFLLDLGVYSSPARRATQARSGGDGA